MALELPRIRAPWSVLDRYIIGEILAPFLFGVGLFSSLGFAVGVLFDLVRRVTEFGLPLSVAFKVAALSSPQFICYAFPMSILLATLMAYSRLAADSELIALRSVGVSVYRIVVPGLIVSLAITALTFIFNDIVVPRANYYAAITLEEALTGETPQFQDSNILYPEYHDIVDDAGQSRNVLSRLFYAERYDGQSMHKLTVVDRSQQGISQIITSDSAQWNPRDGKWDFFNGTIYLIDPDGSFRNILRFDREQLQLPRAPLDLVERVRDNTEMTITQARDHLKVLRISGDLQQIRKITVRLHQKISFPFACFIFGLVGAALGTRSQGGRATSFAISVLTIFLYYTLFTTTGAMGVAGVIPPFPSAWITNVLGLAVGGVILFQVAR
ncbi:LptF/LptG family permease [Spirulina major CS-329]|uniref:LptF/LptG family permease n=1 Tax=Spirulina TaxID=1154 RepID=UPI00232ADD9D|nr:MULTISPECIES: LptF/LptG family permease [Spirulina]MDB9494604.1 LptF/LptG family permease [Spirulina subsalsa CS-330]MDB9504854.1 LptF/LptG family permease [Spirulina major CS-329]